MSSKTETNKSRDAKFWEDFLKINDFTISIAERDMTIASNGYASMYWPTLGAMGKKSGRRTDLIFMNTRKLTSQKKKVLEETTQNAR